MRFWWSGGVGLLRERCLAGRQPEHLNTAKTIAARSSARALTADTPISMAPASCSYQ
jgi:hypothetical protein